MGNDYRREATRQYLRYFRIWFIAIGVLALVLAVLVWVQSRTDDAPRGNTHAPAERVYDDADVLTDEEEESLRSQIAKVEKQLHIDIVIVTIDQSVEGRDAMEKYGYRFSDWERNMQDLADDFWDDNGYGYNKDFEGDGVLLLHNWYQGQNGEHLSTSGRAERALSSRDIDNLLYYVDRYYANNPYKAYSAFVNALTDELNPRGEAPLPWPLVLVAPLIAALVFATMNLNHARAKDTTAVNAYVVGGKPVMTGQRDDFIRKQVITRRIQTSSGGGGHGGGGGHHHSSSGASHGGGSHRH